MKLNKFLALAFLLWVSLFVCAQNPVSFTSDQGLSNTCIRSMKQDSRKNVWICTQYGLNRFDGAKMNVYHYKSDEKGSLGHDNTTCVLEQEPGKIYRHPVNFMERRYDQSTCCVNDQVV